MGKRLLSLYDIVVGRIDSREKELLENKDITIKRLGNKMEDLKCFCDFLDTVFKRCEIETLIVNVDEDTNRIKFTFNCYLLEEHQDENEMRRLFSMVDTFCIIPKEDEALECVFEFPNVWELSE